MRTKITLLTAALIAAGVASSMAQSNVYSLNVVGYVNVPIKAGFNMIENPLDDGAGDTLTNIIGNASATALPDGCNLYPFTSTGYGAVQTYFQGFGWYDGNSGTYSTNLVPPGAGFFLQSPSATNITFVGTVLQGATTNKLFAGFTMTGSTEPLSVPIGASGDGQGSNTLQFPAVDGDNLYLFTNGVGYYQYSYFGGYGWYDGNNANLSTNGPVIGVGQAFFIQKTAAASWVQNFTVN